jgi:competence protein ComEC
MCIALLGVLFADPWATLSPGFWLSFGAVALILFVSAHRIRRQDDQNEQRFALQPVSTSPGILKKILRIVSDYATVQWAMSIGLIPVMLALFGQISLVAPVANAFAIPLVSLVVVPLALTGAALPWDVPLWLAHIAMDITMTPLHYLSDLPQAVWTQHAPPAWSIVFGMLGVIWVLLPNGFPSRYLGGLLMLPMFLNGPEPPAYGSLRLIIFDVGQGLSVAMQTRNHTLLYDTGPDYSGDADNLVPTLRAAGIASLDGVMLSHDDIDHTGGTSSILQSMPVGWISSSKPVQALKTVSIDSVSTRRCQDGENWNWDGVQFDILHPGKVSVGSRIKDNDLSCVLRVSTGNQHILLAADIEKSGEQRLLREHGEQLSASLLVVPHHGSANSSRIEFVGAVLPEYAVFTSGYRNRFGHPKIEIQQRYVDSGATLLRSDKDGAILGEMNAQGLTIERYRRTHRRYWTHVPN